MRRKFLLLCLAAILACALLYLYSPRILMVRSQLEPAGAIIVLGGENGERVFRAAELYADGLAPFVIVTGSGDCRKNRERLILAQVRPDSILMDCESRSTAENAEYSVRFLRNREIRKAIIVTTWWHTARAVNCFEHFAPEIQFLSVPAYHGEQDPSTSSDQLIAILFEHVKTLWYLIRHGIH